MRAAAGSTASAWTPDRARPIRRLGLPAYASHIQNASLARPDWPAHPAKEAAMLAACAELNELPLAGASRWLQWGPGRAGCWRAAVSSAGSEHRCVAACHRHPSEGRPQEWPRM